MSIEADLYNTIAKFKSLEVDSQQDYYKDYLYSIVTESAMMEGATISSDDTKHVFEDGVVAANIKLRDVEMALDLMTAYREASEWASKATPISDNMLNRLCSTLLRRTGKNFLGSADLCPKPDQLADFCEKYNIRCQDFKRLQMPQLYDISFDALLELSQLMPWNEGNHRMARLVMYYFQNMFGIMPTKILFEDRQTFEDTLKTSDLGVFRMTMFELHIKNINREISEYCRRNS